ncbi:hypothetical protein ACOTTU_15210 [Roseobacter sp. EG26]|uniref:hypothetical protein n=1 Tax=Roseobacter sp. EG26 TaxID=3412477 RepID=UPI003CE4B3C1
MTFIRNGCVSILLTVLGGCTTTQPFNPAVDTLAVTELDLATATFREMCIETLPDFSQVAASAQSKGFVPFALRGLDRFGGQVYRTGRKSVVAMTARFDNTTPVCGVAFLGPKDGATVQKAFLAATSRALGGNPRQKMRAPKNDAAYHLRNGSALIFETRAKIDGTSHHVYLTPPMSLNNAEQFVLK